jgi:DNA (cytosine-5)-methyltransferase 1
VKSSDLTVTDLFCGAGGSSSGAAAAGVRPLLALNHWRRAIETHNTNFPDAEHHCVDVMDLPTTRVKQLRPTHILVASPECTNHSQARSKKAEATLFDPHGADEAERSRATMMDVPRFAEQHGYEIVVVENVIEVMRWAGFTPWLQYMRNLGYDHELLFVNSLIAHPTPQSRDRFYCVFWKRRNRRPDLRFTPPSWCPKCDRQVDAVQSWRNGRRAGKYRQQYDYRCSACAGVAYPYAYPAASAIDWAIPTQRIGDRRRPLALATRRRVEVGLGRFGPAALVQASGHLYERPGYARTWPTGEPMPTQTAARTMGVAVSEPFLALLRSGRPRTVGMDDPLATVVADGSNHALVQPPAWLLPITRSHDTRRGGKAKPVDEPMPTLTGQAEWGLASLPFLAELRGAGSDVRGVDEPLATVVASGNHHALVTPAFYVKNYGRAEAAEAMAHSVREPLGTVTGVDHHSLVTLPFLTSYYGQGGATPVSEPVPTVTTRDRHALVEPAVEVDDCGFRMLEPHEIQRAMAFADEYIVTGNKRERVRQLGNAVTPPVMRMILDRCVETLA